MSEYIPENPFGAGIEESDGERFLRKLRASTASGITGMSTAYVATKAGVELVTVPMTIATIDVESLALYYAAGAAIVARRISFNYVHGLINPGQRS